MFDPALSAVICVDADAETIHFYTETPGQKANHQMAGCRFQSFDEDFFQKFEKVLKTYLQKNPAVSLTKVSLVLPDHVFLTDTVNIPTIGKKAMEHSLELAVGAVYKNKKDLKYRTYPMAQNKQFATYGLVGIRKELLTKLHDVCADYQVGVQNVTFAASAMVNGAFALNPKLKNGTFLLLDIKEDSAKFAFVNKGRTIGAYRLPFGYSMLYKSRLAAEDLLFDHAGAELLVLNAKEKAKAKQLTMMGEEILVDPDAQEQSEELQATDDGSFFSSGFATDAKKTARKLPKFMQRDLPTDREGFVYENFRIFLKWTLDLIANNPDVTALGALDTVYVNMPREFEFLYDKVNAQEQENKVKFAPLLSGSSYDTNTDSARDLELFGGFYVKQYNKINNF